MKDKNLNIFKVVIIGSRNFTDYNLFCEKCDYYLQNKSKTHLIQVITGNHGNSDRFAIHYAKENNYQLIVETADNDLYNNKAMYFRNKKIIEEYKPNACIAFNVNKSKGTKNMINFCKLNNITVKEIKITM